MKNNNEKKLNWAVIGGGNGGQASAGHLGIMGFPVTIFDVFPETVIAINELGGIHVDGVVEGFGKIEVASINMKPVVNGADIIMVVAPALVHKDIATQLSNHLEDGQIIFLHPGSTFGALEFRKVLNDQGCKADVIIAEGLSLLYACRATKPGYASILGIKEELKIGVLPASKTEETVGKLAQAFPQFKSAKNVLETSLSNLNAMMHPAPSLLNTSMIESKHTWNYYWDGITPSIGNFVVNLDKERLELAKAFDLDLPSVMEMYDILYSATGDNLTEAVRNNMAYEKIVGQKQVDTRYILEDIPMGLAPMMSLAKKVGTPTSYMETVCNLGSNLLERDLVNTGRTLENLELEDMSITEFKSYIETGIK
jgi:opine dehydrogenase